MKIIAYRKILLIIAAVIMTGSLGVILGLGLNFGIDFTGGALTEVSYPRELGDSEKTTIESELDKMELGEYSLRNTTTEAGRPGFVLRTRDLSEEERIAVEVILTTDLLGNWTAGEVDAAAIERFTSIGPVIGEELKDKAVWAVGAVVLIIIFYVAFAFAGVGKPVSSWAYGGITILALAHDVLVPTALMAVLGAFFGVEIDVLFIMALLAVLGYSVNDTIVVFDRVRENLIKFRQEKKRKVKEVGGVSREEITYVFTKPFEIIVGESVDQTILRSFNTSATTLFALSALYFFGGEVTHTFSLILIAGVLAGTYSSLCIANPLLVWYAERQTKKEGAEK